MKEFYFRDNWEITSNHVICYKLVLKCCFRTLSQFPLSVSFATNSFHLPVVGLTLWILSGSQTDNSKRKKMCVF